MFPQILIDERRWWRNTAHHNTQLKRKSTIDSSTSLFLLISTHKSVVWKFDFSIWPSQHISFFLTVDEENSSIRIRINEILKTSKTNLWNKFRRGANCVFTWYGWKCRLKYAFIALITRSFPSEPAWGIEIRHHCVPSLFEIGLRSKFVLKRPSRFRFVRVPLLS